MKLSINKENPEANTHMHVSAVGMGEVVRFVHAHYSVTEEQAFWIRSVSKLSTVLLVSVINGQAVEVPSTTPVTVHDAATTVESKPIKWDGSRRLGT